MPLEIFQANSYLHSSSVNEFQLFNKFSYKSGKQKMKSELMDESKEKWGKTTLTISRMRWMQYWFSWDNNVVDQWRLNLVSAHWPNDDLNEVACQSKQNTSSKDVFSNSFNCYGWIEGWNQSYFVLDKRTSRYFSTLFCNENTKFSTLSTFE